VPFHGGSSDNIGSHGQLWGPQISLFWFELNGTLKALDTSLSSYGSILVLATRFPVLQKEQNSVINTDYHWWKNLSAVLLISGNSLSTVSLTLVNNLSFVSTSQAITVFVVWLIPVRNNQKA
jgi:hypothetical protein